MLGKRFIFKRSAMILIVIVAMMTLTAGVAVAAGAKAKFTASSDVGLVGLEPGVSTVESKFKVRNDGTIKSVKILTVGEGVFGAEGDMVMDSCVEKGEHSEGACEAAGNILNGGTVLSVHSSKAKLKVLFQDDPVNPTFLVGTLKGKLNATISLIAPGGADVLSGPGKLKIRSSALPSTYICIGAGGAPLLINDCMAASGPQPFLVGPTLVPFELHVVDTGKFDITSEISGIRMKGKLKVTVDSVGGVTTGEILVTKGKALIPQLDDDNEGDHDSDNDDDDHDDEDHGDHGDG